MPLSHLLKSYLHHPQDIITNIFWRFPKKRSKQNAIFVIGVPRSGTTLIKEILSAHSNIQGITTGENLGIFNYSNIFDILKYSHLLQEHSADEIEILFNQSSCIIDFFDIFASFYLRLKGGNRFLEKTGVTFGKLSFLKHYFPNAKFVHIFRDGRDCYCSAVKHPHVYQGDKVEHYAKHWKNCINARFKYKNNPNFIDVKYEHLTTNPELVVKEIMLFLEEKYEHRQIDPKYYHNQYLVKSKHHQNLGSSISNNSHNRWKTEMNNSSLSVFNKIAGHELTELGYQQ